MMTVREAAFDVMRRLGMTTIFGNPASTEISFLADLPDAFRYVLALHEGCAVGIATGHALGHGSPAFVNLHSAAGLGNAVSAIANARDCRAPLVIVVGQQDRRHLAFEPFLAGRDIERLAGDYVVWRNFPARPQDLPGAIARAYHEALGSRGPALVVAPMGDWSETADPLAAQGPVMVMRPVSVADEGLAPLAQLIAGARHPLLVVGAGVAADPAGWDSLVSLAERLSSPVWQEPFAGRAGFPQDHALFAGDLPWMRDRVRQVLGDHDVVLTVGTSALRGYIFDAAVPVVGPGTTVAVLTDDPAEAYRGTCDLAVVAPIAAACARLADMVPARDRATPPCPVRAVPQDPPAPGDGGLLPAHVFTELALRLPSDAVLVEETPSTRLDLLDRIPARTPLGFFSNGGGWLGFGLTGAVGLRDALPERPVVTVIGDGSAMYTVQALWTAAHYDIGLLAIVMRNKHYPIMDTLAKATGA